MYELQLAPLVAFMGMGMQELMIVGVVAVLLFGKRLPEVAKSLGQSYSQFRKGLNDLQSSINYTDTYTPPKSSSSSRSSRDDYDDYDEPTAPKFEPPPSAPRDETPPTGDITKPVSEK
ncbi:MAG: twin-arginine translocase TatA/TatE family subunit [Planctomycetota bacterium]